MRSNQLSYPAMHSILLESGCKGTTKNAHTQIFLGKNAFLYKKSAYVLHLATVASGELALMWPQKVRQIIKIDI